MRLRRWLARAAAMVLVAAAAAFFLRDTLLGTPVQLHQVVRGTIVQTVVASGRIMTPRRVSVGAVVTGRVASIPVDEGQVVRHGAVLIVLDDKDARAALAQAGTAVTQAETKLRQLREVGLPAAEQALLQAQVNATNARKQYERSRDLRAKGYVSQAALDDAERAHAVALSQEHSARLQVQTNSAAGSDFALAREQLEQARAGVAVTQARLAETVVSAPVDGTLIARDVEVGDVVQPGKVLMLLAPAGENEIVVQIDEKNLGQLKLGQQAVASADAFAQERFDAELVYINPGIDAVRGSVEVKLRVPKPPPYLRQDMTVSVDIEVDRRTDTLVVPADTVHDGAGPAPWVMVFDAGRARRQAVKLGLRGTGQVEIVHGVDASTRLISTASGAIRDGQRVRAGATPGASAP